MSTFKVTVILMPKFGKHPNADTLSISSIEGCPVIFRTGDFNVGDKAVYIPVDSIIPTDNEYINHKLAQVGCKLDKKRLRAKKLRGIFSMGLLLKADTDMPVGSDVAERLGITKYEEPIPTHMNTGNLSDPQFMPIYDMESYRKYKHVLSVNDEIVVTEKIHGCNGRFLFKNDEFWVGSHRTMKKEDPNNLWWKVAAQYDLFNKLKKYPDLGLYGEVYGIQDLKYDIKEGEIRFAAFDLYSTTEKRFLDYSDFQQLCVSEKIPMVPVLYCGLYEAQKVEGMAEGKSSFANNIKEGIVIKTKIEKWNNETSRTILKLVSEAYLLRNNPMELH